MKWIAPAALAALLVLMSWAIGLPPTPPRAPARVEAEKRECAAAIASSIGHSTTGYADKLAYEAAVRDKCDGLSIDGKPIGR